MDSNTIQKAFQVGSGRIGGIELCKWSGEEKQAMLHKKIDFVQNYLKLEKKAKKIEKGQFKKLVSLGLWNNKLQSLRDWICNLLKMKSLNVGNNLVQALPDEIVQLDKLEQLYLQNNQLNSLPASIAKLKKTVFPAFFARVGRSRCDFLILYLPKQPLFLDSFF